MEREPVHELTAAYALDALDAHDVRVYEDHLATCERCREELTAFQETAGALAFAATAPAPAAAPALRDRILEAARAERKNGGVVLPFRRRWVAPALAGATAVAACAAIGLAIWAASLSSSLDDTRSAASTQQQVLAVLADPQAARTPVSGADGTLVVARDGRAALLLRRIPRPPAGKTYEAWVIGGNAVRPAGVFEPSDGTAAVVLERPVPRGATVAVTVERDGGVRAPTQKPHITARA